MLDSNYIKEAVNYGSVSRELYHEHQALSNRLGSLKNWHNENQAPIYERYQKLSKLYAAVRHELRFSADRFVEHYRSSWSQDLTHNIESINRASTSKWSMLLASNQALGGYELSAPIKQYSLNDFLSNIKVGGVSASDNRYVLSPKALLPVPEFDQKMYEQLSPGFDVAATGIALKDALHQFAHAMHALNPVQEYGYSLWQHEVNCSTSSSLDCVRASYSEEDGLSLSVNSSEKFWSFQELTFTGHYCLCICLFMTRIFPAYLDSFAKSNDQKALGLALKYAAGSKSKKSFWQLFTGVFNEMVQRMVSSQIPRRFGKMQDRVIKEHTNWYRYGYYLAGQFSDCPVNAGPAMVDYVDMCAVADRMEDGNIKFAAMGFSYFTSFYTGRPGDGWFTRSGSRFRLEDGMLAYRRQSTSLELGACVRQYRNANAFLGDEFTKVMPLFDWNTGTLLRKAR